MFRANIFSSIILIIIIGLNSCTRDIKFDKIKWNQRNGSGYYDCRDLMLEDLLQNHNIKGSKIDELRNLFGEINPISLPNGNSALNFNIVTDFKYDIDPQYTKDLILYLDKDSVVSNYKIKERNAGEIP